MVNKVNETNNSAIHTVLGIAVLVIGSISASTYQSYAHSRDLSLTNEVKVTMLEREVKSVKSTISDIQSSQMRVEFSAIQTEKDTSAILKILTK